MPEPGEHVAPRAVALAGSGKLLLVLPARFHVVAARSFTGMSRVAVYTYAG